MKRSIRLFVFLTLVSTAALAATGPFTTRVAFTTNRDGNDEIYTVNANGSIAIRLTNNTSTDAQATYSLDGKKIAFMSERDGNFEIYVMNADGTGQTRLTNDPAFDVRPAWSPDGNKIVFMSNRGGNFDIFSVFADGIGGVQQLTNNPASDTDPSFSPNGSTIAFMSNRDTPNPQIYTMSANGLNQTRLTNTGFQEVHPRFSRNGQKIAFARHVLDNTGFNLQIHVMNANGTNAVALTSAGANSNPVFSADDKRIFFNSNRDGNNELYSMAVDGSNQVRMTGNTFSDIEPSVQSSFEVETVGTYRPTTGQWTFLTENQTGALGFSVFFGGQPGDLPVAGNWDGDTRTDIGVFRNGTFHLALLKGAGGHTLIQELAPIPFGQAGDLPVAGDWNGDGKDDVGVFRPGATGRFLLRQPLLTFPNNQPIIFTIAFDFGTAGDLPVAGDWNGNGVDTPGVYRGGDSGSFFITNTFSSNIDASFLFGGPADLPLAGDWVGVGTDGVGLLLTSFQTMILTTEVPGKPAITVTFGPPGDIPVAGSWLP
jgi:Tol biopolymer transport system component